jgi:hypothetical protein
MNDAIWTEAAWARLRASTADHGCTPIVLAIRGPEGAAGLLGELATIADADGALLFRPAPVLSLEWRPASKEVRLNIGWHVGQLEVSLAFPLTLIVLRPLP